MIISPVFEKFAGRFYDMPPVDSVRFEAWIESKIVNFSDEERSVLKRFLAEATVKESDLIVLREAWRDAGAIFTFTKSGDVSSFFEGVLIVLNRS